MRINRHRGWPEEITGAKPGGARLLPIRTREAVPALPARVFFGPADRKKIAHPFKGGYDVAWPPSPARDGRKCVGFSFRPSGSRPDVRPSFSVVPAGTRRSFTFRLPTAEAVGYFRPFSSVDLRRDQRITRLPMTSLDARILPLPRQSVDWRGGPERGGRLPSRSLGTKSLPLDVRAAPPFNNTSA